MRGSSRRYASVQRLLSHRVRVGDRLLRAPPSRSLHTCHLNHTSHRTYLNPTMIHSSYSLTKTAVYNFNSKMEPTSLPTWDHLTYSIPPNSIGADLHPFQEYILKMAAMDYVHRPPQLTESGEEMNFYLGFEDQHHLLLSWVLDNGYTEPPHQVRPQNNLYISSTFFIHWSDESYGN